MIKKLEEGCSLTNVAQELEINKSIVSHAWKVFQTIITTVRMVGGGRHRKSIYRPAGKKSPIPFSKRHCLATVYSSKATSLAVYCDQTPSQRSSIRQPSWTFASF
ncbi:hypothetical protein TNCV_320411 [Trichonephila clavipes]|nr:hypothetical protein TNCV_320411 [Trichonephila clavipes]